MHIRVPAFLVLGALLFGGGFFLGAHFTGKHPGNPGWAPIVGPVTRIILRHSDWEHNNGQLEERWAWASKSELGSVLDSQAIYNIELPQHAHLAELRWISSDMAMGYGGWYEGNMASARFYYLFLKQDGHWTIYRTHQIDIT